MKQQENFFTKTFSRQIYTRMLQAAETGSLTETLIQMQTSRGVDPDQAGETAQQCIAAAASCEGIRDAVSADAMAVLNQLLESLQDLGGEQRTLALHKLYFGLTAHQDPGLRQDLERGVSTDELFWRYYSRQLRSRHPASPKDLEKAVRQAVQNFYLPPEAMQALARKLAASGDYLASAAALGENGTNYKCIAAMELYLNSGGSMTIHEAANLACAGVQAQAAADAVSRGFLSRDMARKILLAAAIAAVIIGVGIFVFNTGAAMAAAQTAAAMAEAVNANAVLEIPAVFSEFATATTASGAPGIQYAIADADMVAGWVANIRHEALVHQVIGAAAVAGGAAMAVLSDKTAALVGQLSILTRRDRAETAAAEAARPAPAGAPDLREEEEEAAETAPAFF